MHHSDSATIKPLKQVISVDIDDVIGHLFSSLAKFHNDTYGSNIGLHEYTSYNLQDIWGGSVEETNIKIDRYFESPYFQNVIPIQGAVEALLHLLVDYEFHAVTARSDKLEKQTLNWIDEYFPNIFTKVHFGNAYDAEHRKRKKSAICQEIGAVLHIDDAPHNAIDVAGVGIHALVFGNYPWNR